MPASTSKGQGFWTVFAFYRCLLWVCWLLFILFLFWGGLTIVYLFLHLSFLVPLWLSWKCVCNEECLAAWLSVAKTSTEAFIQVTFVCLFITYMDIVINIMHWVTTYGRQLMLVLLWQKPNIHFLESCVRCIWTLHNDNLWYVLHVVMTVLVTIFKCVKLGGGGGGDGTLFRMWFSWEFGLRVTCVPVFFCSAFQWQSFSFQCVQEWLWFCSHIHCENLMCRVI